MLTKDDMAAIDDLNGEFPSAPGQIDENFEFDSSGTTEDALDSGGFIDQEGWYHFQITKVEFNLSNLTDDGKEQTPHILVTCKSLNNMKGQSPPGSILWHRIYVGQKDGSPAKQGSIESMYRFGIGCGLLKWGKNAAGAAVPVLASTGLPKIPMSAWKDAVAMQFIAAVKKGRQTEEQTAKYGPKFEIPMGRTYRPDHPDVAHVQKDLESLAEIGIVLTNVAADAKGEKAAKPRAAKGAAGAAGAAQATTAAAVPSTNSSAEKVREPVGAAAGEFSMDDL